VTTIIVMPLPASPFITSSSASMRVEFELAFFSQHSTGVPQVLALGLAVAPSYAATGPRERRAVALGLFGLMTARTGPVLTME
jgi:hypothetical protein